MLLIPITLAAIAAVSWKALNVAYTVLQPSRCTWCGHALDAHIDQEPC